MRSTLTVLIITLSVFSWAQNLEVSGGYIYNTYTSQNSSSYQNFFSSKPGNGFSFGFGFDSVMLEILPLKFSFFINQYDGYAYEVERANAGGHTIEFYGKNTVFMIQFHFVNLRYKRIGFSAGCNGSFILDSKHSGFKSTWMITGNNHYYDLSNDSTKNETNFIFGVSGSIRYFFPITTRIEIAPQYRFYISLSSEFSELMDIGSIQHIAEIGLIYKLQ